MAWTAGNLINRLAPGSVTWNSITFATVLSIEDNYPAAFNTSDGGGSLVEISALRKITGEVTVTYQGSRATRIIPGAYTGSLVANFLDQDGNAVATTYPYLMADGEAFQQPNSDFGTYVQKFRLNAPLGTTDLATVLPTTA